MITATRSSSDTIPSPTGGLPGSTATSPGGAMGKNEFLKMLITQLKNQDPLNPLQGDQMASELAQFSSLEQLTSLNETLSGEKDAQGLVLGALQAGSAIGTLGHTVVATGNQLVLGPDGSTSVTANVSGAGNATLHIYNASGADVGSRSLGAVNGGTQTFALGAAADGLPPGQYTYSIDVTGSDGKAVAVQTYMSGRVDGVRTGANGLTLTAGGLTIPYASVIQILK